ncbi:MULTISPECIES: class I adenylate-forming enzyme family protein [unclassified Achromobacter]|uniref:class I adenylate-forming enzyme family protein n=1 Tax=unclassified Achromobacter TaxID=2626865 RepID=UPI000B51DF77|nr:MULTISPECIES: class I adenylate-forming enzyme family protein [unclassified Achromobacter]OWT73495.1 acid--CoA ligase [Achromobacter sp. HZ34]OWT79586.1 acid--CoA ligase [Achromobacter sp. HZ28]
MLVNLGKLSDAAKSADDIAIIDCIDAALPRIYTHGDIDRLADACARGLLRKGLPRGASIALMSLNRAEFIIAYLGIMRAGMVAVPVNYKVAADTLALILDDCKAQLAFVDAPRAALLPPGVAAQRLDDEPAWQAFLDEGPFDTVVPAPDDCAMILYTSGSTGRPKGVQLSHGGQLWTLRSRLATRASFLGERFIVAAPLFHMNALASVKFALAGHASVVLLPQFETLQFIDAIGRHGVTWVTSVPTMMAMVVKEKEALSRIDTSKVHYVRMGSASASASLYDAVKQAFPNASLAGGYGTTEAGPIVFGPVPGKSLPGGGGLGWPLPGVEVRLVDSQEQDVGADDEGELWMRTPANMLGYLNLPEKTAQVLTPDNWYKSGDVFRRDAEGCYYFVGRADDMFNCGGENIYPGEVEQVISRIPEVMQTCVVPVRDEMKGQKPVAFVVRHAGKELSEQQVKEFVLANAPAYQHPRRVYFVDALPLAPTNKVDRKALMNLAEQG